MTIPIKALHPVVQRAGVLDVHAHLLADEKRLGECDEEHLPRLVDLAFTDREAGVVHLRDGDRLYVKVVAVDGDYIRFFGAIAQDGCRPVEGQFYEVRR